MMMMTMANALMASACGGCGVRQVSTSISAM